MHSAPVQFMQEEVELSAVLLRSRLVAAPSNHTPLLVAARLNLLPNSYFLLRSKIAPWAPERHKLSVQDEI